MADRLDDPQWVEQESARRRARRRTRPARIDTPAPGEESVWAYPRPPAVEPVDATIAVVFNGVALAESSRAVRVLETAGAPTYYVPPTDVRMEYLRPAATRTLCEWKGVARYWDVTVAGRAARDAAWSYPAPFAAYAPLADWVAFFAAKMDACLVGPELVRPQPGGYYGGWITSGIVGPFKGAAGTEDW